MKLVFLKIKEQKTNTNKVTRCKDESASAKIYNYWPKQRLSQAKF